MTVVLWVAIGWVTAFFALCALLTVIGLLLDRPSPRVFTRRQDDQ